MISKAKIKYIHSLELKKNRKAEGIFVAEGHKVVGDLMDIMTPTLVVATAEWLERNSHHTALTGTEIIDVTQEELRKVSFLQHPQQVLALFPIPTPNTQHPTSYSSLSGRSGGALTLALDGVQDPGNLGTIIRIADWFGIEDIVCSLDTADVWNPKVVQATMGSIARVRVNYCNLSEWLDNLPDGTPIYGTMLDGRDIKEAELKSNGIIIMGNEGNGISPDIAKRVTHKLLIPNYPAGRKTADSLNVAIATAITCFAFRNR